MIDHNAPPSCRLINFVGQVMWSLVRRLQPLLPTTPRCRHERVTRAANIILINSRYRSPGGPLHPDDGWPATAAPPGRRRRYAASPSTVRWTTTATTAFSDRPPPPPPPRRTCWWRHWSRALGSPSRYYTSTWHTSCYGDPMSLALWRVDPAINRCSAE